jgi:PAS domain S-box-containing protein
MDLDGTIRLLNPAAELVLGYEAKEDIGKNLTLYLLSKKISPTA